MKIFLILLVNSFSINQIIMKINIEIPTVEYYETFFK